MVHDIRDRPGVVQEIDRIARLLSAVGAEMRRMVGRSVFALDHVERAMRHVPWITLPERATAARKGSIRVDFLGPVLLG